RPDDDAERVDRDVLTGGRHVDAEVTADDREHPHDDELGRADAEGAQGEGEDGDGHRRTPWDCRVARRACPGRRDSRSLLYEPAPSSAAPQPTDGVSASSRPPGAARGHKTGTAEVGEKVWPPPGRSTVDSPTGARQPPRGA